MSDIMDQYELFWKKSDVEERYMCKKCGKHTDLVSGEEGLKEWDATHKGCDDHHAPIPQEEGDEPVVAEEPEPEEEEDDLVDEEEEEDDEEEEDEG